MAPACFDAATGSASPPNQHSRYLGRLTDGRRDEKFRGVHRYNLEPGAQWLADTLLSGPIMIALQAAAAVAMVLERPPACSACGDMLCAGADVLLPPGTPARRVLALAAAVFQEQLAALRAGAGPSQSAQPECPTRAPPRMTAADVTMAAEVTEPSLLEQVQVRYSLLLMRGSFVVHDRCSQSPLRGGH